MVDRPEYREQAEAIPLDNRPCNCFGALILPVYRTGSCDLIGYGCGHCGHKWPSDHERQRGREDGQAKTP